MVMGINDRQVRIDDRFDVPRQPLCSRRRMTILTADVETHVFNGRFVTFASIHPPYDDLIDRG
jgi:hypothetical protein